jgi:two-component sensor histidine kinase
LKKIFNALIALGLEDSQSSYEKRRIKTTNLINLLVIILILIGYSNYFIIGSDFAFVPVTTFMCLSALSLYLNKIHKNMASFLLFSITINLSIFFINEYYPFETGTYLFYFPLIVSVVLLNNPSFRDKYSVRHFAICAAFFVAALLLDFPDLRLVTLKPIQIRILWYFDFVMATLLTGVLTFLLTRIIYNQNKEIIVQNDDLKKAKEIVNVSLKEKEVLLAELHHRVKNNLAIISGLLNLQEEATVSEEAKQVLSDSKTRIMSMALVHKMLYESVELKSINLGVYASELINELLYSYNLLKVVKVNEDFDAVTISVNKSIPLGLVLNEVITNCIKYTYKPCKELNGVFNISIKLKDNQVSLIMKDNGTGFPKDFNTESDNPSLGIYLIKTLAEQIDAKVWFSNEDGAKIELNFSVH